MVELQEMGVVIPESHPLQGYSIYQSAGRTRKIPVLGQTVISNLAMDEDTSTNSFSLCLQEHKNLVPFGIGPRPNIEQGEKVVKMRTSTFDTALPTDGLHSLIALRESRKTVQTPKNESDHDSILNSLHGARMWRYTGVNLASAISLRSQILG